MRLKDKIAIVTGAAQGFGAGIAERYAQEGARMVLADIDAERGERTAAALQAQGAQCRFVRADVGNGDDMKALVAAAVEAFGGLDIMVNNAGVSHRNQSMLTVSESEFDRVFRVNVKSIYWSAIHAVPEMTRRGGGSIINIASTAGVRPRPGLTWYNGSKGAVITMSKSMAVELAPQRIRVNCVNPVAGETPLLATFMGEDTPEMRAKFIATIPMGRLSLPADVAVSAVFFGSDESSFITGTCMEVDGGRCV